MSGSGDNEVAGIVLFLAFVAMYFVPAVIAFRRRHHNAPAIFAVNLLLGWTALGWIAALVWSLTSTAVMVPVSTVPVVGATPEAPRGPSIGLILTGIALGSILLVMVASVVYTLSVVDLDEARKAVAEEPASTN